jgi:ferric-dicitrate binding protein FerR (iron transport regulator)
VKESKKDLKTRLKIKTPGATVGVRGTDFYVSYEPNAKMTEQATLKGSVEVEQLGSGQKVMVEKGQQVKVEKVIEDNTSKTLIHRLKQEDRIEEIAQFLAGNEISEKTRAVASDMLTQKS